MFSLVVSNGSNEAKMLVNNARRKRRRKPTVTPRFGSSSIALEIGLLRMALDAQREFEKKEEEKRSENK